MKRIILLLGALVALLPQLAGAWWNADWTERRKITLDTSDTGGDVKEAVAAAVVAVRLHTGNFAFGAAKQDGSDLRFVAADDKTPLKHFIEKFDAVNELAVVWVLVPRLAPGSKSEQAWLYYGNGKAPAAEDAKGVYDPSHTLVLNFGDKDGAPRDATGYGNHARDSNAAAVADGLLGGAVNFDGSARIVVPASESLRLKAAGGFTFAAWLKSADAAQTATLYTQADGGRSITIALDGGRLVARIAGQGAPIEVRGPALPSGTWTHVGVSLSDRVVLYLNGAEAGAASARTPDLGGDVLIGAPPAGAGFRGEIDALSLSNVARSGGWMRVASASGPDGKLVGYGTAEGGDAGGGSSYLHILLSAVTLDGWIVIGILMVMLVVSFAIMILKTIVVAQTDRANQDFLERFQASSTDLTALAADKAQADDLGASSLFRLYRVGVGEVQNRFAAGKAAAAATTGLSAQSINAIRASIDAGLVRESHKLNSQMVLLTIAISGGPFLGLLGTVVGVMITFAAIAAAGDVNVNAIAPGIAAALVATVAGLAVAIPALFGYNYLASRIKNITADMQVFADEFVAKVAEQYSS